ncbi:MAG TPA: Rieske (2Fe-2S) protein [Verrucomicrobiae bacterium]|nr:Rieske (2Fe-2S) protein [Verrucomicrobiae bacterium]
MSAGFLAGCQATDKSEVASHRKEYLVDVGLAQNYAANGVYSRFRDQGFFLVHRNGKLFALSAYCTHRRCKLTAEADGSFYCKCHGSTFDPAGNVTGGPARRDLPVLPTYTDERGDLQVKVSA